jgi:hypothetical protein
LKTSPWKRAGSRGGDEYIGLLKLDLSPPLLVTAHRAKGFDLGLVAVLQSPEDVMIYGEHPAHQKYVLFSVLTNKCAKLANKGAQTEGGVV